jgi:hypothetical protein
VASRQQIIDRLSRGASVSLCSGVCKVKVGVRSTRPVSSHGVCSNASADPQAPAAGLRTKEVTEERWVSHFVGHGVPLELNLVDHPFRQSFEFKTIHRSYLPGWAPRAIASSSVPTSPGQDSVTVPWERNGNDQP